MKYRTIVADPPWHYESMPGVLANGHDHRVVMGKHVKKALPYKTLPIATTDKPSVRTTLLVAVLSSVWA